MQGLIIHSATGEALSSDEITAAHRVADTHKEMRAGVIRQVDALTGATVEYHAHKRMAMTTPGTGIDYVKMALPNPIPYRGVSIGVIDRGDGFGLATNVVVSNGQVLVREKQARTVNSSDGSWIYEDVPDDIWMGGSYINMRSYNSNNQYGPTHQLTFTVPEDCIYPINPYDAAFGGLAGTKDEWKAGQAALAARRKAWLKKNSDIVLKQIVAGTFVLPPAWDYALKHRAPTSYYTYRPTLMSVSHVDSVASDTSANLTQEGTLIKARTATFAYCIPVIQPDGTSQMEHRQDVITGTHAYSVTAHAIATGGSAFYVKHEFANWYSVRNELELGDGIDSLLITHLSTTHYQILEDTASSAKAFLIWNGVIQNGVAQDSQFSVPTNPLTLTGYTPPAPLLSNTLVGTTPQFVLDYRKAVPIKYDKTGELASTAWNDSALQDGQTVKLIIFGPAGKGIFGEWEASDTSFDVFGAAIYTYNAGIFSFKAWAPLKDADGSTLAPDENGVPTPKTIDITNLKQPTTNAIVEYRSIVWPDAIKAGKDHVKDIMLGPDAVKEVDAVLIKMILVAAKSE